MKDTEWMYTTIFRPILNYGCFVLGGSSKNDYPIQIIEKVQRGLFRCLQHGQEKALINYTYRNVALVNITYFR